jgi:hypothetical protein
MWTGCLIWSFTDHIASTGSHWSLAILSNLAMVDDKNHLAMVDDKNQEPQLSGPSKFWI